MPATKRATSVLPQPGFPRKHMWIFKASLSLFMREYALIFFILSLIPLRPISSLSCFSLSPIFSKPCLLTPIMPKESSSIILSYRSNNSSSVLPERKSNARIAESTSAYLADSFSRTIPLSVSLVAVVPSSKVYTLFLTRIGAYIMTSIAYQSVFSISNNSSEPSESRSTTYFFASVFSTRSLQRAKSLM